MTNTQVTAMPYRMTDEHYEATKQVYAQLFACMEGYRQTLKRLCEHLD